MFTVDALCRATRPLLLAALFVIGGCGENKSEPITDLTDEHQKQLKELNEQRAQEWGPKK